jgi:cytoskeleton protein RodZ
MSGAHLMSDISTEPVSAEQPADQPPEQTAEQAVSSPAAELETAGALIRKAREASGLHIAALAVSLKVSVKKLEALESNHLELLPDAVFVRGLASSVCRALKIDPAPILAMLPNSTAPLLIPEETGINAPFKAPGDAQGQSAWSQLSRPVVLASLVLLCGALVLIFFPAIEKSESVSVLTPPALSAPGEAALPILNPANAANVPEAASPEKTPGAATSMTAPAVPLEPGAAQKIPFPPAGGASAALPNVLTSATAAASGILVFSTRSESWVEVTDAKGVVQLRTIILPGTPVKASGALPLSVVVGRADATEVLLRGRPYSLTNVSKDNVARFEVK